MTKGEFIVEGEGSYREGDLRWVRGGFAYGPEQCGPDGVEYMFFSLGPYDKLDPDEFPPPLGRWDDPSTWVEGYPQVFRRTLLAEDPRRDATRPGGAVTLTITPLDAPLGAEVTGFDFDRAARRRRRVIELLAAIDEHLLLVFRNDALPTEQQVVDFCESFGPLKPTLADRSRLPAIPASTGSRTATPTACRAPEAPAS